MSRFAETISNEDVAQLPAAQFGGRIIVVDNRRLANEACDYLSRCRVLGFDTETRPSFTAGHVNRVALLQLSTEERCYLIRINKLTRLSGRMLGILSNEKIMKVGVAVSGDLTALRRLFEFEPRGFVELQNEVKKFGIAEMSLRKMAGIVLGCRVSKAQRLSNWEASSLTPQQRMYAATDAWSCLRIYNALGDE